MILPSYLNDVLPGGKYHAIAMRLKAEPNAVMEISHDGIAWNEAHPCTSLFHPGVEWRIKPQVVRYRVALMQNDNGAYCHTTHNEKFTEAYGDFVRWVTDWIEVTV